MKFDKAVELLAGERIKPRYLSRKELVLPIASSMKPYLPSFFNQEELQLWIYEYNQEIHVEIGSSDKTVNVKTLKEQKTKFDNLEKDLEDLKGKIKTYRAKIVDAELEVAVEKQKMVDARSALEELETEAGVDRMKREVSEEKLRKIGVDPNVLHTQIARKMVKEERANLSGILLGRKMNFDEQEQYYKALHQFNEDWRLQSRRKPRKAHPPSS